MHALEKKANFQVTCEFALQTRGTEVPLSDYSLPSLSKQLSTLGDNDYLKNSKIMGSDNIAENISKKKVTTKRVPCEQKEIMFVL